VESMLHSPGPRFYRLGELGGDVFLMQIMAFFGVEACAVVPILGATDLYGAAIAGWTASPAAGPDDRTLPRLEGVADHVAAGMQNASLIEQVRHQALHDPLTGLANQILLRHRVDQAIARAERRGDSVGVFFIDLDRFKEVNDSLGHLAGNELLCQVSARMVEAVRRGDLVTRLGGDEFIVVAGDLGDPEDIDGLTAKLSEALCGIYPVQGSDVSSSASVGVALYPRDGKDFESLLRHADLDMYAVKRSGRRESGCLKPA